MVMWHLICTLTGIAHSSIGCCFLYKVQALWQCHTTVTYLSTV